mgnify:CR=1 FL=1
MIRSILKPCSWLLVFAHAAVYNMSVSVLQTESKRSSIRLNDTSRSSWASSGFDLKNSKPDELLGNLLDNSPIDEIDSVNNSCREVSRHKQLFAIYQPQDEVTPA